MRDKPEYYPPSFVYWDAEYQNQGETRTFNIRGDRGPYAHDDMSWVICSVYKVGEKRVQTSMLRVNQFPSFCGGVYAHSPRVRVTELNPTWETHLNGVEVDLSDKGIKKLPLVNVKKWGVDFRTGDGWKRYGMRVAAHGLLNYMATHKRRGVVMSGRVNNSTAHPVTEFVEELANVKQISYTSDRLEAEKLYHEHEAGLGRYTEKRDVEVANVDDTTHWVNANSGRS